MIWDEVELEKQFTKDLQERVACGDSVGLHLDWGQAWVVFSHLQLALGHPSNAGHAAEVALAVAKRLEAALCTTPALKEVARRGWADRGGIRGLVH